MRNIISKKYGLLILLLLLVFLAISFFALRSRQDIRKKAVEPELDVVVKANPAYKILTQNQQIAVKLVMTNRRLNIPKVISGAQANIDIDTSRYTIESIVCGNDFSQGLSYVTSPLPQNGRGIGIFCAVAPKGAGPIIRSGELKTFSTINMRVKPNAVTPQDLPPPVAVKINSVRVTQYASAGSGNAYNVGQKGENAYLSIVSPNTNAIGVYPLNGSPDASDKCSYYVSWVTALNISGKVTFQHSGEPVVSWCPTSTGTNPCASWTQPVTAQTPAGKTTTFRLYNVNQPTAVLDTAVFTCSGTAPSVTPTQVPTPTNPINWSTAWVSLQSDDFYILVDLVKYTGQSADLVLNSDPPSSGNPDYTTLEAIWHENNKEMRIFIYLYKNTTHWWSSEIRTYNNQNPGNWIYHRGEFFKSPLGTAFNGDFSVGSAINGQVYFKNLRLTAFNIPGCTKKPIGDANCDEKIDGRDYSIWLRSQCSRNCVERRADFNNDAKVDEADRQIWIDNRG